MLLTLLASLACVSATGEDSDGDSDPCMPGGSPSVELGFGELAFEVLDEDAPVELVYGPQGGYHVTMAIQGRYFDSEDFWEVQLSGWIDGVLVGYTAPYGAPRCNTAVGVLEATGLLLVWDAEPEDLHGRVAEVEAVVLDQLGNTATATNSLTIWDSHQE